MGFPAPEHVSPYSAAFLAKLSSSEVRDRVEEPANDTFISEQVSKGGFIKCSLLALQSRGRGEPCSWPGLFLCPGESDFQRTTSTQAGDQRWCSSEVRAL